MDQKKKNLPLQEGKSVVVATEIRIEITKVVVLREKMEGTKKVVWFLHLCNLGGEVVEHWSRWGTPMKATPAPQPAPAQTPPTPSLPPLQAEVTLSGKKKPKVIAPSVLQAEEKAKAEAKAKADATAAKRKEGFLLVKAGRNKGTWRKKSPSAPPQGKAKKGAKGGKKK